MEEKVKAFLDRAKEKEQKQKEKLLRKLELTSDEIERVYVNDPSRYKGYQFKKDSDGRWYTERKKALEISDDEFRQVEAAAEILGLPEKEQSNPSGAHFLEVMSFIFLGLGIIGGIALTLIDDGDNAVFGICLMVVSVGFFAFIKALVSMNNNLEDINRKLDELL